MIAVATMATVAVVVAAVRGRCVCVIGVLVVVPVIARAVLVRAVLVRHDAFPLRLYPWGVCEER